MASVGVSCRVFGAVLCCVVLFGVLVSAAAAQVEAPARVGSVEAPVVHVGLTTELDVADAFSGTVDSYAAVSSDPSVVEVSVSGSVVSLRGVAWGYALVRVTATNSAGSATQRFSVDVTLAEPLPGLVVLLGSQSTTIGAVVAFDLSPVFSGRVASYGASSSDEAILEATVDETIVVLRGVGEGTATATVTATNLGGTRSMSFAVTVGAAREPVAPPQTAAALAAQEFSVGATLDVGVAAGFAGTVDAYIPVSGDRGVLTARPTASGTVQLTGVAEGATTLRVVAANRGGIASQTLDVTVTDPALRVRATAPSHCLTGEGTPTSFGTATGRTGIATIDVAYRVTGGAAPYAITSADALAAQTTPTGTLAATCARAGINPNNVAADANAVESGPKTITVTVTDTNGDTAITDVTVEIVEDAYTTEYNDGTMQAGKTYVIGTTDQPHLMTLPQGLTLEFAGLSDIGDNGAAHLVDTVSGSEIVLDWGTGSEIYREIAASSTTSSGAQTGRSAAPTPRNVDSLFNSLRDSVTEAQDVGDTGSRKGNDWRPYAGLPDTAWVAAHPNMLLGKPIEVCNRATVDQFDDSENAFTAFNNALNSAIDAWNDELHMKDSPTTGTPHKVFQATDVCPRISSVVHVYRDVDTSQCEDDDLACAWGYKGGRRPPTIGSGEPRHFRIIVKIAHGYEGWFETLLIHELGHFLGLGDYKNKLVSCPTMADTSIMTDLVDIRNRSDPNSSPIYDIGPCGSNSVTGRDSGDAHAIYHPDAIRSPNLVDDGGWRIKGTMPYDEEGNLEYSAYRLAVGGGRWGRLTIPRTRTWSRTT